MKAEEYMPWDEHAIKMSEIVFAYMEQSNPSGFGLSCEVGYALGRDKTVIVVNESDNKYLNRILDGLFTVKFQTLSEGIDYLSKFPPSKIFLSGGMRSGWQEEVINACPMHTFFDPRSKEA